MIDGLLTILLVALIFTGFGILLGWSIWGDDMEHYKNLAESYKKKLESQDVDIKEVIIRYLQSL